LDKSPNKGKFDIRGKEGIFVGYCDKAKAYRVWDPKDRKIHVSRDVKFFNEFNAKESYEDFTTPETKNGRLNVMDSPGTTGDSHETHVGPNIYDQDEEQPNDNQIPDAIAEREEALTSQLLSEDQGDPKEPLQKSSVRLDNII